MPGQRSGRASLRAGLAGLGMGWLAELELTLPTWQLSGKFRIGMSAVERRRPTSRKRDRNRASS